jgi:hypothetical protein
VVPDPKREIGGGEGQKTNFYPKHLQSLQRERNSSLFNYKELNRETGCKLKLIIHIIQIYC